MFEASTRTNDYLFPAPGACGAGLLGPRLPRIGSADPFTLKGFKQGLRRALVGAMVVLGAMVPAAQAESENRAAVVVDTGAEVKIARITFSSDSVSGVEALQIAGMDPVVRGYGGQGGAVCALCGRGCPADSTCLTCGGADYWAYFRAVGGASSYTYSPVGAGSTRVHDGDVEAWKWGPGVPPAFHSFAEIWGESPTTTSATTAAPPPATTVPPTAAATTAPTTTGPVGAAGGGGEGSGGGGGDDDPGDGGGGSGEGVSGAAGSGDGGGVPATGGTAGNGAGGGTGSGGAAGQGSSAGGNPGGATGGEVDAAEANGGPGSSTAPSAVSETTTTDATADGDGDRDGAAGDTPAGVSGASDDAVAVAPLLEERDDGGSWTGVVVFTVFAAALIGWIVWTRQRRRPRAGHA